MNADHQAQFICIYIFINIKYLKKKNSNNISARNICIEYDTLTYVKHKNLIHTYIVYVKKNMYISNIHIK